MESCCKSCEAACCRSGELKIYSSQEIEDSDASPVAVLNPGDTYMTSVPVRVHQKNISVSISFTCSVIFEVGNNNLDVQINILRDGETITKGNRSALLSPNVVAMPTPYVFGRTLIFSDNPPLGKHEYTLLFQNMTDSTLTTLLRVITFTITC